MSDEERLELQMVDRYQERLTAAKRLKLWHDTQVFNEQKALEALRGKPQWPERHKASLRDQLTVLVVLIVSSVVGGVTAWGMWKLFN